MTNEQIIILTKLHDEIFECEHEDVCALIQIEGCHVNSIEDSECTCGFGLVCDLLDTV